MILAAMSCGSKPTDPRTVLPADTLVYLESSDLGKTLSAITDNPKFQQLAKTKPNLSALNGVRLSVAVTGFETSEQQITEDGFVGKIIPRFVVAAETNAWSWQTTSFVENQLGEFVNEAYGGEVQLEMTPRNDGKFYVWTSPEGRKAYALQQGSLVFFGNDETAIERCQAVKRGEIESIEKNPKIPGGEHLAFGYISPDGVGQISNLAGISLAMGASEEVEVKSFVARVLPEILRNSIKEMTWTASKTDEGIEDKVVVRLDDESSRVFAETIVPAPPAAEPGMTEFVPQLASSVTRYRIRDPQLAWRSVVLTARKRTDETSGTLIAAFSGSVFEPYGIEDAEMFLSSVGPQLITVKLGAEADDAAVIAAVKDRGKIRTSIAKELNFARPAEKQFGADVWKSEDGELAAGFVGDLIVIGDADVVAKCLEAKQSGENSHLVQQIASSDAAAVTAAVDPDSTSKIIGMLSEYKNENENENDRLKSLYRTETRFNRIGLERRTVSDFGLIGSLIVQLAGD